MTERRGAYVTFDGGEGTGKSTQVNLFGELPGIKTVREPGQTEVGKNIRSIVLGIEHPLTVEAELLLFSADRNATINQVIIPALAGGKSVVSDRSYLSLLAYQCYGGGLSLATARQVTDIAVGNHYPDMSVIFDAPPEVAFERMAAAGKYIAGDRFERMDTGFHNRVRAGFLDLAKDLGSRAMVVDASGTPEETFTLLTESLSDLLIGGVEV